MASTTVREVIDGARIQHPAFTAKAMPDGACALFLRQRLRTLLLAYHRALAPFLSRTVTVAVKLADGTLQGATSAGLPVYDADTGVGTLAAVSDEGAAWITLTGLTTVDDAYGPDGESQGWPLPTDFIGLSALTLRYSDGSRGPAELVEERMRHEHPNGRDPVVFIAGNRLVPVRDPRGGGDEWSQVVQVTLTYLPIPAITAMTTVVQLPDALIEALSAALAGMMARAVRKELDAGERQIFLEDAARAEQMLGERVDAMTGALDSTSVIYRD